MVIYKDGDMTEYKQQLIEAQNGLCAVTMNEIDVVDGEVLFLKGIDYFISKQGLLFLRQTFGEKFIDTRLVNDYFYRQDDGIIHYPED